ncbi:hypothetical protein C4B63_7g298 [Trypanosoma cruzi]|uniref:Uncharacterized protein n=1 Tax=Trypanosoma cruzi TaxID=5693 RepID=A0A2V2VUR0_TRYCR|nr:hypothetical protein C4B63_7g298 [Trypanosoma cruzi]
MAKMMNACFFGLFLITAVAGVHAGLPFTEPKGPMPDTIELAESALAPFMAFDGGHLYLSKGQQDIPVVCGSESSAKSRIVLPVTLNDLDRLHGTLPVQRLNQTSTASEAQLDIVEGCYVLPEGKDRPCVASLNSTPEQCNMNIRDSTAYWTHRERLRKTQNSSQILGGGADLLVNHFSGFMDCVRGFVVPSDEHGKLLRLERRCGKLRSLGGTRIPFRRISKPLSRP